MPTQEEYKSKEYKQKLKQALAALSLDLFFQGHPKYDAIRFERYIALQYHLAICYLKQDSPDLFTAINFAEQAKMDMLTITSRTDPKMRPFYTLLLNLYSATPEIAEMHANTLRAYTDLLKSTHPEAVGTPVLPDLEAAEFVGSNFSIPLLHNDDIQTEINALKQKLYKLYLSENAIFFGSLSIESAERFEKSIEISEVLRQLSEKYLQINDLASTIISMQRGGALLLDALMTRFGNTDHPSKKAAMLHTMQTNYANIASLTTVDYIFSAAQVDNASIYGPKQTLHTFGNRQRGASYTQPRADFI